MNAKIILTATLLPIVLAGCGQTTKDTKTTTNSSASSQTVKLTNDVLKPGFIGSFVAYPTTTIKQHGRTLGTIKTPMVIHIKDRNIYSGFGKSTIDNVSSNADKEKLESLIKTGLVVSSYGMSNYQVAKQTTTDATIKLINNSGLWPDAKAQFKNPNVSLKLLDDGKQLTFNRIDNDKQVSAATNPSNAMNVKTNTNQDLVAIPETDMADTTFSKITNQQGEQILKQKNLSSNSQGYGTKEAYQKTQSSHK